jgi:5-methylcytosine-specific restriction enzyme subunit McrC
MTVLVEAHAGTIRRLGKIPVRNLWLLMFYASDLYRYIGSSKVDVEENPDEIADLVAAILCGLVEERLKCNLSYGYESKVAVVSRIRGRIDSLTTERQRLLEKGKICCRFDELTVDTSRNRHVRAALECLAKLDVKSRLVCKCRSLAMSLERLGVSKIRPANYSGKSERFGRNDISDQKMVAAADLAFSLALPTESDGQFHLTAPDTQKEWLRALFEKAIAGFYTVALDKAEWIVLAGKHFDWQISDKSAGIDKILPSMKTDIIVDQRSTGTRLVIDTKFNAITTSGWHRDETLRSGYIYQMYAYLRSQENMQNDKSFTSIGMLLHPAIDKQVTEMVTIQGHPIWFCTVDLSESAMSIRKRLLWLVNTLFHKDA